MGFRVYLIYFAVGNIYGKVRALSIMAVNTENTGSLNRISKVFLFLLKVFYNNPTT